MGNFKRINVPVIKCVPGEHDAGLDNGALYRDFWERVFYSFDIVRHFIDWTTSRAPNPRSAQTNSRGSRKTWLVSMHPRPS